MKADGEQQQRRADGGPAPVGRRWRVERWVCVVLFAVGAFFAWREYRFREAIKEAKAMGWEWYFDDPIEAIQKDWTAAFRSATWFEGKRELSIVPPYGSRVTSRKANRVHSGVDRYADVVHRLRPRTVLIYQSAIKHLSLLEGLTEVRELLISDVDLTNVDALKGLSALRTLDLPRCFDLTNLDGLKGLSVLQKLNLEHCSGLTNVDALKGLTGLHLLNLYGCNGLSYEAVTDLRAALPNTKIVFEL